MTARVLLVALVLAAPASAADPVATPQPRKLAYPAAGKVPASLADAVKRLTTPGQPKVPDEALKPLGVFARLVPREAVLDGATLRKGARLGGRPFVFLSVPESFQGKSLLEDFTDIGYSADSVLADQLGREMSLVIFRYTEDVALSDVRDGKLGADWAKRVYAPTWDNAFALLDRLAADAAIGEKFQPDRMTFASEKERMFVLGYPATGQARIRKTAYAALRETGGADWEYRLVLERKLGLSEHFTGTGFTRPAIGTPKAERRGLPEFVGPNPLLETLKEVAVVDLGAFRLAD